MKNKFKVLLCGMLVAPLALTAVGCGGRTLVTAEDYATAYHEAVLEYAETEKLDSLKDITFKYETKNAMKDSQEVEYKENAADETTKTKNIETSSESGTEITISRSGKGENVVFNVNIFEYSNSTETRVEQDLTLTDHSSKEETTTNYSLGKVGEEYILSYSGKSQVTTDGEAEIALTSSEYYTFESKDAYLTAVTNLIQAINVTWIEGSYNTSSSPMLLVLGLFYKDGAKTIGTASLVLVQSELFSEQDGMVNLIETSSEMTLNEKRFESVECNNHMLSENLTGLEEVVSYSALDINYSATTKAPTKTGTASSSTATSQMSNITNNINPVSIDLPF